MFRRLSYIPASLAESHLADLVPLHELQMLEQHGTTVRIVTGDQVIRKDAIGRECMVVVDGAFAVQRDGELIAELQAGDFMGEVALLTSRPRNATVTALEDSSVCVFNPREFSSLLDVCPAIAAHVRAIVGERALVA
jgi:CRP-like cAMP-binding protein